MAHGHQRNVYGVLDFLAMAQFRLNGTLSYPNIMHNKILFFFGACRRAVNPERNRINNKFEGILIRTNFTTYRQRQCGCPISFSFFSVE